MSHIDCPTCHGSGEVIACVDDMCHGLGECIHGRNMVCPTCGGDGFDIEDDDSWDDWDDLHAPIPLFEEDR